MPFWTRPYKIRRSTRALSFAVKQCHDLLEVSGECVYLLQRKARSNAPFLVSDRRVSTITQVASAYTTDPDTGNIRFKLWGRNSSPNTEFPDVGTLTVTVQASGGASVWELAYDKYSFIAGREEFAVDIYQDRLDSAGVAIEDSVYVVFNTPPYSLYNLAVCSYGTINPLTNFEGMQPVRDNETNYQLSLFGFSQWLNPNVRIRSKSTPNAILLAFPGILSDFHITDGGLLQETGGKFFTSPPPYSPKIYEHDVIIRQATGERYQIISFTPIYLENILVQQQFDMHELDPRSSIYNIEYSTT